MAAGDSSTATSDEIAEIVSGAGKPRRRARKKSTEESPIASLGSEDTIEREPREDAVEDDDPPEDPDLGLDDLPSATAEELDEAQTRASLGPLPKPVENVKTLDDLMAKYNIGEDPQFSVQVHRTYPKYFAGGRKADGFYDEWYEPVTQEKLLSEYGGGVYSLRIMGPNPTKPNHKKHYDSIQVSLAGDAKAERVPRALQGKEETPPVPQGGPATLSGPFMQQENPKLAETAMKVLSGAVDAERQERHRIEDRAIKDRETDQAKALAAATAAQQASQPLADAERRRADDLIAVEREKGKVERDFLERQLQERDDAIKRLEERMNTMEHDRPSIGQEMKDVAAAMQGFVGPRAVDDGASKMGERVLDNVLQKHAAEMEAVRNQQQQAVEAINRQHQATVESMRSSHEQQMSTLRASHAADLQSRGETHARAIDIERDTMRRREERFEDQLKAEREERRRDQEMFKTKIEDNDRVWKERLESQKTTVESAWEHRHASTVSGFENRILWLQTEGDRLRGEVAELKAKAIDTTDPIAIVHKAREMKEALGVTDPQPQQASGGGIALSNGSDLMGILEIAGDKLPGVLQGLGSLLRGPGSQQPPPQYHEGQIVAMKDGQPGVVVPDGHGGWAVTPKAAYDAHQAALAARQAQQQGRGLPQPGRPGQPRVMPSPQQMSERGAQRARGRVSITPNLARDMPGMKPLTRQKAPWEGEEEEEAQTQEAAEAAPQQQPPRRTSRPVPQQQEGAPEGTQQQSASDDGQRDRAMRGMSGLSPVEEQGLKVIARLVHHSVLNVDEPEEFVGKIMGQFSRDILKQVVGNYTPEEIAQGISVVEPGSAGATAEGQKFVKEAFKLVHEQLAEG